MAHEMVKRKVMNNTAGEKKPDMKTKKEQKKKSEKPNMMKKRKTKNIPNPGKKK